MPCRIWWTGRELLGDDVISYTNYEKVDYIKTQPEKDFMTGDAGNDVLLAGKGGDTLIGGTGNDIMDGGANGTGNDPWMVNDVAEYQASIDRFVIEKVIFEGKALKIMDSSSNKVAFTISPVIKGKDTFGSIKRAGEDKEIHRIKKGDTFFTVSDSLSEEFGGEGTDILFGMEQARFGFDWDGTVNFQVNYMVHTDMVDAEGTLFGDVIDLRGGKKTTEKGFGGLNDFNTGMDIWDADFQTALENQHNMATSGFDKWNWKPGNNDTPQAKGVTSLLSPYKDASPINGKFDIYKTTDGKNTIYLAFDAENNMVAEEVKQDGGNWKIKYEGVVDGAAAETLSDHEKAYMWKPTKQSTCS